MHTVFRYFPDKNVNEDTAKWEITEKKRRKICKEKHFVQIEIHSFLYK